MSKEKKPFRFKRFAVEHGESALKVGVDGVLVGAWASIGSAKGSIGSAKGSIASAEGWIASAEGMRVLDAGCGCGLIALMLAQRMEGRDVEIEAVDVDIPSVMECRRNIEASPWRECVKAECKNFMEMEGCRYDMIVSNPPYFDAGVSLLDSARLAARHAAEFSPEALIRVGEKMLEEGGRIVMIVPLQQSDDLAAIARECGMTPRRRCRVRGHADAEWKRALLEFEKSCSKESESVARENDRSHIETEEEAQDRYRKERGGDAKECDKNENHVKGEKCYDIEESLTLERERGIPTEEYRALCGEFYLKF